MHFHHSHFTYNHLISRGYTLSLIQVELAYYFGVRHVYKFKIMDSNKYNSLVINPIASSSLYCVSIIY